MKEAGFTHWAQPNVGATNASGFTGYPSSYHPITYGNFNRPYYDVGGLGARYWSSTSASIGRRLAFNCYIILMKYFSMVTAKKMGKALGV